MATNNDDMKQGNLHTGLLDNKQKWNSNTTEKFRTKDMQKITANLASERKRLPIYPVRKEICLQVKNNASLIVIGETGSGKTTQIPQFLYHSGLGGNGIIACTQPRRVAAVTIAERVASEMGTRLGSKVGYTVRFDDTSSPATKIKYMTDGMLLREAMNDQLLRRYNIIILDEAHVRTIHTDILFGVIKNCQQLRATNPQLNPLKIMIMSATLDPQHFINYLDNAKVIYIEGRQFPIQIMYTSQPQPDYLHSALVAILQVHKLHPPHWGIVVFLTGQEEIESLERLLKSHLKHLVNNVAEILICPMFAGLPPRQQMKVFEPSPSNSRKVVLATNLAETSVTIKDIKIVIDTGMVKVRQYNSRTGFDVLTVQPIAKDQALQRTGRAGRESSGMCYRLYTEDSYHELSSHTRPEIQRCNLTGVALQMLAIGIKDVINFDFIDRPPVNNLRNALEQLYQLGAVEKMDYIQLTQLGKTMARFPLEPRFSKILLTAKNYNCTEEIVTLVALLSEDSILYTPYDKREQALEVRRKLTSPEGDHVTLLNLYKAFKSAKGSKDWCYQNFINIRAMKSAIAIRQQLCQICQTIGIPLVSCNHDTSLVRRCLLAGLFLNTAELQTDSGYLTIANHLPVAIHPTSCLFGAKPAYVVYTDLVQTTKCYMRDLSLIEPEWLSEMAPDYFRSLKN
ncbi:putative ATP-dependent RNA helicase DHX33 [Trichoplax sp. H2]|nr:putative ATP-dependent RNA helicase DHX33 [Trichoplax sp. H2]|eukprot:RDD47573.1 putative ATP-dependent RNA helicase DHX33 [Trichoplax sp. H2]